MPHAKSCRIRQASFALILCFLCWTGPCWASPPKEALTLTNAAGKEIFSILPDSGFAIRYRHSVALTPVTDYFRLENGLIALDRTVYQDFGAGLPHNPEGGQTMCLENGKLIISGFDRKMPEFTLRVGRVARHELIFEKDGKEVVIPLSELAKPGAPLTFRIKNSEAPF